MTPAQAVQEERGPRPRRGVTQREQGKGQAWEKGLQPETGYLVWRAEEQLSLESGLAFVFFFIKGQKFLFVLI